MRPLTVPPDRVLHLAPPRAEDLFMTVVVTLIAFLVGVAAICTALVLLARWATRRGEAQVALAVEQGVRDIELFLLLSSV